MEFGDSAGHTSGRYGQIESRAPRSSLRLFPCKMIFFPFFHFTESCPLWKLVTLFSSAAMGAPALQADLGASSGAVLAPTHPTRRDGADGEFWAARPHWRSSPSGGSLCLDGKGVPTLYLIGAQKSGTTALGTLIFNAGGVSAGFERGVHSGSAKELNVLHVPKWPNVCNETATTAVQRRSPARRRPRRPPPAHPR